MSLDDLPKTRKEAKELNSVRYFNGKKCKYGHISPRYTNNSGCITCDNERCNKKYLNNKKYYSVKNKEWKIINSEKRKLTDKIWAQNNKDRTRQYGRKYYYNNRDIKCKYIWEYKKKRSIIDPEFAIDIKIQKDINSLFRRIRKTNNKKRYRKVYQFENHVNFSFEELINHIENQFDENMSWENYGNYWCLDHIKPKSKCLSLEEAWELKNLQPLEAIENCIKYNKYEEQ